MRALGLPLLVLLLVATAAPARAQRGDEPLLDLLTIVELQRELLAIDARSGNQLSERLELDEEVLWTRSRGRVGVVLTDRRILAVAVGSAAWQDTRYLRTEQVPERAQLGERVALVLTPKRVIGFDGGSGNLIERSIGPNERVHTTAVAENVLVVVTERRAMGLSPFVGGFFETPLRVGEDLESVVAQANLATVTTSHRLLVFRAPSGSWEERRLDLR
jgi:hypothetical protein